MKRSSLLMIFLLTTMLSFLPHCNVGQDKQIPRANQEKGTDKKEGAGPPEPITKTVPPIPTSEISAQTPGSKQQTHHSNPDPFALDPQWVTAIATVLYVIVSIGMLRAIRRQADIAEIAANAASKNAQILAETERPWIIEELDADVFDKVFNQSANNLPVVVKFRNHGRTPAWITASGVTFNSFSEDKLPERSNLPDGVDAFAMGEIACPPSVEIKFVHEILIGRSLTTEVSQGKKFLFVYGIIKYRDGMSNTHDTRYCYRLHMPSGLDARPVGFYPYAGGDEYSKYT